MTLVGIALTPTTFSIVYQFPIFVASGLHCGMQMISMNQATTLTSDTFVGPNSLHTFSFVDGGHRLQLLLKLVILVMKFLPIKASLLLRSLSLHCLHFLLCYATLVH